MIFEVKGTTEVKEIFADWQETMVWSCLQGIMGHLYADSVYEPKSAMAILGDFCFFAGIPNMELVSYKPEWCKQDFIIMTASSPEWFDLIETAYGNRAKKVSRFAFKKEPDVFDKVKLNAFAEAVKDEFTLCMIDREIFHYCRKQTWSNSER